jgi:hypothetical protein
VRTALAYLNKPESGKDRGDLPRPKDGNVAHRLRDLHRLRSDELPVKLWGTVLEQHGDDLFEVLAELIEGGALRVRTRPPGYVADEQPRGLVALDDRSEGLHVERIPREGRPNQPLQQSAIAGNVIDCNVMVRRIVLFGSFALLVIAAGHFLFHYLLFSEQVFHASRF